MSQQSGSVDLLGGCKLVYFKFAVQPIKDEFFEMFPLAIDAKRNAEFLEHITDCFCKGRFNDMFRLMLHAQRNIVELFVRKYPSSERHLEMVGNWRRLREKILNMMKQIQQSIKEETDDAVSKKVQMVTAAAAKVEKDLDKGDEADDEENDENDKRKRKKKKSHHGDSILDKAEVEDKVEEKKEQKEGAEDIMDRTRPAEENIDNSRRYLPSRKKMKITAEK